MRFLTLVFFHESVSPQPQSIPLRPFQIFGKFLEIFAIQGAPPVSTTPGANLPLVSTTLAANFSTSFASIVDTGVKDTGGKFATGVNDAGDKLLLVLTTPAVNLPHQTADNLK